MPKYAFTMVSDEMLRGLADAGTTGSEMRAYIMLVKTLPKDRSRYECWMPADMAEEKGVMSARMFTKCLDALTKKSFATLDGQPVPILTKVSRGCKGHCPHYEDNLGRLIAEGRYPANGDPNRHPIDGSNASPK